MREFWKLFMNDASYFGNTLGGTLAVIVAIAVTIAVYKVSKDSDY